MSLLKSKKFLISLGSISAISISAIGIGVGVGVSNSAKNSHINESINNATENNSDEHINKEQDKQYSLSELIKQINSSTIVFYEKQAEKEVIKKALVETSTNEENEPIKTLEKSNTYAFDIEQSQIGLDKQKVNLPPDVSIKFELVNNNAANLNQGRLIVKLSLTKNTQTIENTIEVDEFKKPTKKLLDLFKEENKSILGLVQDATVSDEERLGNYETIESLNAKLTSAIGDENSQEQSGLTKLLHDTLIKKPAASEKEQTAKSIISIEGKIKLKHIQKEKDQTYFYLVSQDINQSLKLIEKDEKNKEIISVALVNEIKVANLAASSIELAINDSNEIKTEAFIKELEQKKASNQFSVQNQKVSIKVPADKSGIDVLVNVFVKAYEQLDTTQTPIKTIPVNIKISYGSEANIKTYNTSIEQDLNTLKESGISFGIYAKKLSSTSGADVLKASDLISNENAKLQTYFKSRSDDVVMQRKSSEANTNGFNFIDLSGETLKKDFNVLKDDENIDTKAMAANVIAFASYKYSGMKMDHSLLPHNLSLIHLEKKPELK